MTFGSLFAGIGGFDLGLERAGMTCKWQVEIDDYATRVLEKHWPHVHRERDVRLCGAHNLEAVDLICGGFPCQDISNAGKRAGIDGERSGLWSEFHRIICELRPRYALVENVAALLGRGMGRVLGDLAACGYDAEWDCIPAAAIGAPHRRDRLFVVAYPKGDRDSNGEERSGGLIANQCRTAVPDATLRRLPAMRRTRGRAGFADGVLQDLPNASVTGLEGPRLCWATPKRNRWSPEPGVCRVADGTPARVDRLRCLGNAVVPQVAEWIGRRIMDSERDRVLHRVGLTGPT